MAISCVTALPIPTVSTKITTEPLVARRSANYNPSIWGDHFLAYSSHPTEVDVNREQEQLHQLKQKVIKMLVAVTDKPLQMLNLIDGFQRLGMSYHFKTEIEAVLKNTYMKPVITAILMISTLLLSFFGYSNNKGFLSLVDPLNFAKLDFNLLHKLHQRELSEITRRILTKVIAMTSIIDDIYDVYGTLEELALFTDVIERWEISALDQFPEYMKLCYQSLLDVYSMTDEERWPSKEDPIASTMQNLKGYFEEAKWFHQGYVPPSMEEYMQVGLLTCGYKMLATVSYVGMGELATKEAFDWVSSFPLIVEAA
ncbi:terpenoid cyclases/Protein prenyltransferases superfamily protein [Actinidia rufa]|uniref:Terpenoid cyclases/Protein prenyltransferases superfamily protein n=1 Tax=Actinidia rufa TaxID=165716 RepID=A0A7J0D7W8_9ERIC|nr:terpenoid cyclases/Protein prenyltransferases superfamily protein [Actinidia rufa]